MLRKARWYCSSSSSSSSSSAAASSGSDVARSNRLRSSTVIPLRSIPPTVVLPPVAACRCKNAWKQVKIKGHKASCSAFPLTGENGLDSRHLTSRWRLRRLSSRLLFGVFHLPIFVVHGLSVEDDGRARVPASCRSRETRLLSGRGPLNGEME